MLRTFAPSSIKSGYRMAKLQELIAELTDIRAVEQYMLLQDGEAAGADR